MQQNNVQARPTRRRLCKHRAPHMSGRHASPDILPSGATARSRPETKPTKHKGGRCTPLKLQTRRTRLWGGAGRGRIDKALPYGAARNHPACNASSLSPLPLPCRARPDSGRAIRSLFGSKPKTLRDDSDSPAEKLRHGRFGGAGDKMAQCTIANSGSAIGR